MKRTKGIWILALLALAFAGDRLGGWVCDKLVSESQFRYSRLYEDRGACDILLVGNSRGLIFFQPHIEEITGLQTLNLSYNGLPIDLARVMVEDYLEHYPAPKTLLLDVTMCDRTNDQLLAGFNLYTPKSSRIDSLLMARSPKDAWAGRVSHLYRYNSEIFQRALYYLGRSDEDWLLDRVINDHMISDVVNQPEYSIELQPYLLDELSKTVTAAQAKGVEVRLVVNPYFPPFADKMTNLSEFKQRIETATGLPVLDYSRAVKDVKGFGDYQHLNKYGSRLLLEQMKKGGVF